MLQQTRVQTVIPYYERFLRRFPTLPALATADEQDVLREWAGLGYYARARSLKRAAEQMVRDHASAVPRNADDLLALPGIGRYTSGAIRSIAFGERAAIVDANVRRVIARLLAEPGLSDADTWTVAQQLVPEHEPGSFNQALMELGATICTARTPGCPDCPLRRSCRAARAGDPGRYPTRKGKKAPREVALVCGVVRRAQKLLMLRRPSAGLLGGLWELPTQEVRSASALATVLYEEIGVRTRASAPVGRVRHQLSHRVLDVRIVKLELLGGRLHRRKRGEASWCTAAEAEELPLSSLTRKVLRVALR
jgi:A/G-specific adenine glycosylase